MRECLIWRIQKCCMQPLRKCNGCVGILDRKFLACMPQALPVFKQVSLQIAWSGVVTLKVQQSLRSMCEFKCQNDRW
ncbi:MAG: hypothetical protein A3F76_00420 [Burkholderiales bacterium RIFCSPLOWO2_12_FULL_65_40]|nr:MAG: hypothetical protein A3F76_00420 [Burkholderiales bacterium RIFCSPLOWO2_12_FULL_65_40]